MPRVLCLSLALVFSAAAFQSVAQIVCSRVTNGVYFGITPKKDLAEKNSNSTNSIAIRFDEKLAMAFFCTNGPTQLFLPVDTSRFIRFEMRYESGAAVRKTKEGQNWGGNIASLPTRPGRANSSRMISLDVSNSDKAHSIPAISWGPALPSASDLFEVIKPGTYFLTIEPRALELIQGTDKPAWRLVAFPPVVVKIIKPED